MYSNDHTLYNTSLYPEMPSEHPFCNHCHLCIKSSPKSVQSNSEASIVSIPATHGDTVGGLLLVCSLTNTRHHTIMEGQWRCLLKHNVSPLLLERLACARMEFWLLLGCIHRFYLDSAGCWMSNGATNHVLLHAGP